MQNVSIHRLGDLPQNVKSAVESVLGRSIGPDEEVSITAVPPQQKQPSDDREAVAQKLDTFLRRRPKKVKGVSEERSTLPSMKLRTMCGTVVDQDCS